MIELTQLNGRSMLLNPLLIERIEACPDTVITLVGGKKVLVKENLGQLSQQILAYQRSLLRAECE